MNKEQTKQFFVNKEEGYRLVRERWKSLLDSKTDLPLGAHILYAILRGKDWTKCIAPITNSNKLCNGGIYNLTSKYYPGRYKYLFEDLIVTNIEDYCTFEIYSKIMELRKNNYKYSFVFVRKDIALPQQIVQVGHACHDAGNKFKIGKDTALVLIGVDSATELENTAKTLSDKKIEYCMFREPDLNSYTAISTQPIDRAKKSFLRKYKLWSV